MSKCLTDIPSTFQWIIPLTYANAPKLFVKKVSYRVQKSDVHLCLFFCFAYRVIITIFLNSIYIIYSETDHQPMLDAWDKCSGLVHWEDPEGSGRERGGRGDKDEEYM